MNVGKLLAPQMQAKIRKLMHMIIIKDNLMAKEVNEACRLGYNTLYKFLQRDHDVGIIAMRKILHFVTTRSGRTLEDIIGE